MGDQFRSKVEQYSPKSSPRGARSPVVSRQDSTGTLKTTISLGKNPSIVHSGPFYLMKEPPGKCFIFCFNFLVNRVIEPAKFNVLTSLSLMNNGSNGVSLFRSVLFKNLDFSVYFLNLF